MLTVVAGSHGQVNTNGPRVIVDAGNGVNLQEALLQGMSKS